MLKHSISHYGSTGVALSAPHPLTSSSHSGDTSLHNQIHIDPTRYLEGPHMHSKSYLDHSHSYPTVHNSRGYLESSRISRGTTKEDFGKSMNGSIYFSPPPPVPPPLTTNPSNEFNNDTTHASARNCNSFRNSVLRSLALLSILSLLLALNSLIFLLKIVWPFEGGHTLSTDGGQMQIMYEVTLCLCAMSLSINLCVLLVTSAQYFFAISGTPSATSFLKKVTATRGIAIGGFFLSVPLFLSAIVLYTFTHLTLSVPALVATIFVGLAIILGGSAMVHHVFQWQQEKTNNLFLDQGVSPNPTIELSTLV